MLRQRPNDTRFSLLFFPVVLAALFLFAHPAAASGRDRTSPGTSTPVLGPSVQEAFPRSLCYFVDYSGGDDFNSGLTPASPWKTLKNVNGVLGPGTVIRFKRGEVWRLTGMEGTVDDYWQIPSKSGTADRRIRITDYGPAAEPPLLTTLQLWDSGWVLLNHPTVKHVWERTGVDKNVNRCFFDGVGQGKAADIFDLNSGKPWCYDDTAGTLYVFSLADPNGSKIETLPGLYDINNLLTSPRVIRLRTCSHVTVSNLALYGGYHAAIALCNPGEGFTIKNCVIRYPCRAGICVYDYTGTGISNVLIENNVVDYMLDPAEVVVDPGNNYYFPETNLCDGIYVHRAASDVIVRNNLVTNFSHSQVQVNGKFSSALGVSHITVEGNEMTAPDTIHGMGWSLIGAEGKNTNNTVRWNYVHDLPTSSHCNGSYNKYYSNIIARVSGDYKGWSDGLDTNTWIDDHSWELMVCHHNELFNNVIVEADGAGLTLKKAATAVGETRDNIIANNIIINCGDMNARHYQIEVADWPLISNNIFLNNCLYKSGVSKLIWYKTADYTVAEANGNTALDDLFISNIDADPLFENYAGGDFSLKWGSPCIHAGFSMGALYLDFDRVLFHIPPSIGSFEFLP